jgi:hypothetical protein
MTRRKSSALSYLGRGPCGGQGGGFEAGAITDGCHRVATVRAELALVPWRRAERRWASVYLQIKPYSVPLRKQSHVFDNIDLTAMREAFDAACAELGLSEAAHENRQRVASAIVAPSRARSSSPCGLEEPTTASRIPQSCSTSKGRPPRRRRGWAPQTLAFVHIICTNGGREPLLADTNLATPWQPQSC